MKRIASGFGDDADLATAVLAIFSVEVAGDDAEFRNRIQVGYDGRAGIHVFFHVAAVHAEVVGRLALAVDGLVARVERAGRVGNSPAYVLDRAAGDGGLGSDARLQRQKVRETPAIKRNRSDLAPRDDLPDLRACSFDMQSVVRDRHTLGYVADFERCVELQRRSSVQDNRPALVPTKSGSGDVDHVVTDGQNRESVITVVVCVRLVRESGICLLDDYVCFCNDTSRWVLNDARDASPNAC